MCAILKNGRSIREETLLKRKIRKLTIVYTPDESNAVVITGNEDFTLYENYKFAASLEKMLFERLVAQYEGETGDFNCGDDKIYEWLSKQR